MFACAKVEYCNKGLSAIIDNHYAGNRRNLSWAEEEELLKPFKEKAAAGQIVEISEIKQAYEEATGKSLENDHGQIYRVLKRHGWRKVMPRSKHPKKANDEVIEASKKLTLNSKRWEHTFCHSLQ
jgi:transposase